MESMEKTNKELLNRLELIHKKKFGYAPKKNHNNNSIINHVIIKNRSSSSRRLLACPSPHPDMGREGVI